jgi:primosomal protein N' (replication factor Y)
VVEFATTGDPDPIMVIERARRAMLGFPPDGAVAELAGDTAAVEAAVLALRRDFRVLGPSEHGAGVRALVFAADPDALAKGLQAVAPSSRGAGRLRVAVDPPRV